MLTDEVIYVVQQGEFYERSWYDMKFSSTSLDKCLDVINQLLKSYKNPPVRKKMGYWSGNDGHCFIEIRKFVNGEIDREWERTPYVDQSFVDFSKKD